MNKTPLFAAQILKLMKNFSYIVCLTLAILSLGLISDANAQKEIATKSSDEAARLEKINAALSLMDKRSYDEALKLLDSILAANPGDSFVLSLRGLNYSAMGKKVEAIADARAALMQGLDTSSAYDLLRRLLTPEAYIEELTKLIDDNREHKDRGKPLEQRAHIYFELGRTELAIRDAITSAQAPGNSSLAWYILDNHFKAKPDQYVAELTKIIDGSPQFATPNTYEAVKRRAETNVALNNYELAIADLNQLTAINAGAIKSDRAAHMHLLRAVALGNTGQVDLALADVNKVIVSGYLAAESYSLRSQIYCSLGKKAEAANDELKVVSLGRKVAYTCK